MAVFPTYLCSNHLCARIVPHSAPCGKGKKLKITNDSNVKLFSLAEAAPTPPGRYQIEVGLYLPVTMERLPVLDENGQPVENRVLLCEVQVE